MEGVGRILESPDVFFLKTYNTSMGRQSEKHVVSNVFSMSKKSNQNCQSLAFLDFDQTFGGLDAGVGLSSLRSTYAASSHRVLHPMKTAPKSTNDVAVFCVLVG